VDLLVERQRQPAAVPAGLGRVQGGDQRRAGRVGQGDRRMRDQPVVGVHHVRPPVAQQPESGPDHGVPHRQRPRHQVAGELQVRRVLGDAHDPDAARGGVAARVGAGVGAVRLPAQHHDVVPGGGQPHRQRVHVPAQPAHDHRWILPRQHQDAHGRASSQAATARPRTGTAG
jgi:hypothetical protein